MSEWSWFKSWMEVNNSYYVGIGKDMTADIYNQDEDAVGHDEERD